ncbi:hypothetical protein H257_01356 [Aphanomyces astaci]|uniref:Uncharacterized protein n=1 Tax=Aphanomyces astaci TaxID=112090 RepID=W4HA14_APHAT|nr:hypothetical protein H257_01356 [Aphanomyces astaci]ETV87958.1 hypothetical protein H257_01356 [Aphanomyces astaci]|eukprot:XP_009822821.1 hypothetical protein H257_01356 [Aphanomyces astaci]
MSTSGGGLLLLSRKLAAVGDMGDDDCPLLARPGVFSGEDGTREAPHLGHFRDASHRISSQSICFTNVACSRRRMWTSAAASVAHNPSTSTLPVSAYRCTRVRSVVVSAWISNGVEVSSCVAWTTTLSGSGNWMDSVAPPSVMGTVEDANGVEVISPTIEK